MPITSQVPKLACDCHMHVFGTPEQFPGSPTRAYTPTVRSLAQYKAMAAGLGFSRIVFVQPSAYGIDNRCMLEAMTVDPQNYRGVAVIGSSTGDAELAAMNRAGVRGIRLNLVTEGAPDSGSAEELLQAAAKRVAPLGWHIQIYAGAALLGSLAPVIRRVGVPVVLDHMAGATVPGDAAQAGFPEILDMLAAGIVWVKLSGADRVTDSSDNFPPATPIARALVAANSRNLVWGTDWPHLGHHSGGTGASAPTANYRDLDDNGLLSVLRDSVGDEATWNAVLVENPARLYGF